MSKLGVQEWHLEQISYNLFIWLVHGGYYVTMKYVENAHQAQELDTIEKNATREGLNPVNNTFSSSRPFLLYSKSVLKTY